MASKQQKKTFITFLTIWHSWSALKNKLKKHANYVFKKVTLVLSMKIIRLLGYEWLKQDGKRREK